MIPKFTLGKNDKVYISDKFLCNGRWLCTREIAQSHVAPKTLKPLLSLQLGCYDMGIAAGKTREVSGLPDFAQIIPKRDGYVKLLEQAQGVEFRADTDEILAYKFRTQKTFDAELDFTIGVAAHYVPLMRMGACFAKDALSPVIVLDGTTLNDNLLAIVMPFRLNK